MTKHTQLRCKCTECGLHFVICTWHPDKHTELTITCPECGQKKGNFQIFQKEVAAPIFTVVPGDADFAHLGGMAELLKHFAQNSETGGK